MHNNRLVTQRRLVSEHFHTKICISMQLSHSVNSKIYPCSLVTIDLSTVSLSMSIHFYTVKTNKELHLGSQIQHIDNH